MDLFWMPNNTCSRVSEVRPDSISIQIRSELNWMDFRDILWKNARTCFAREADNKNIEKGDINSSDYETALKSTSV